jgi:hypothetical protein
VRVVSVSSLKHLFAPKGGVDYDSLVPNSPYADYIREKMGGDRLYCQSKWVSEPDFVHVLIPTFL